MLGYVKAHGGYCGLDEDGYFRSADIVVPTPARRSPSSRTVRPLF